LVLDAHQGSRLLPGEQSAEVAQKGEHHPAFGPQRCQGDIVSLKVLYRQPVHFQCDSLRRHETVLSFYTLTNFVVLQKVPTKYGTAKLFFRYL
jgi:hypothetical protein